MAIFYAICWALLFILRLQFPPGQSVSSTSATSVVKLNLYKFSIDIIAKFLCYCCCFQCCSSGYYDCCCCCLMLWWLLFSSSSLLLFVVTAAATVVNDVVVVVVFFTCVSNIYVFLQLYVWWTIELLGCEATSKSCTCNKESSQKWSVSYLWCHVD